MKTTAQTPSATAKPLAPASGSETATLKSLAHAAKQLCEWTRHNQYPEKMTTEFMHMTQLIDNLDTEVRRVFPNNVLAVNTSKAIPHK